MSNGALRQLGLLTIGQAPRDDVVYALRPLLPGVELDQAGALDDLAPDEIEGLAPRAGGHVLVTRLRDGSEVQLDGDRVLPLMQAKLDAFWTRGVTVVMLFCTGGFPTLHFDGLLLEPRRLVRGAVRAVAGDRRVGVLVPAREQVAEFVGSWRQSGINVIMDYASPYARPEELNPAVDRLVDGGAELLVMDCIGYRPELKAAAQQRSGLPVMLANTTAARIAAELLVGA